MTALLTATPTVAPKADLHAVFVTVENGDKYRISNWGDWHGTIDLWTALDDQRREARANKGTVTLRGHKVRHYEVRSEHDPAYRSLSPLEVAHSFAVLTPEFLTQQAAAKAVLKPLGYFGKEGGWIYFSGKDGEKVVNQGWVQAATTTGHRVVRLEGEAGYRATVTRSVQVRVSQAA